MIAVNVKMDVVPEKQNELLQTLRELERVKPVEKGYLKTDASRDVNNEHVFNFTEVWKTREDAEQYIRSNRFSILLGAMKVLTNSSIHTALHTLEAQQLRLKASEVGGQHGRKILFHTHTGDVLLKR